MGGEEEHLKGYIFGCIMALVWSLLRHTKRVNFDSCLSDTQPSNVRRTILTPYRGVPLDFDAFPRDTASILRRYNPRELLVDTRCPRPPPLMPHLS